MWLACAFDVVVTDVFMQNSTLEKEKLKSGDILLIEEDKLPPKVSAVVDAIDVLKGVLVDG